MTDDEATPQHNPAPSGAPLRGALVTVLVTYAAALLFGAVAGLVGSMVPCEGLLCSLGYAFVGAVLGVLASAAVAGWVAHRAGLRWWYLPIAYGTALFALLLLLSGWLRPPWFGVPPVVALAGPPLGAALAARLRPPLRAGIILLVGVLVLAIPVLADQADRADRQARRQAEVDTWRAAGLPVWAPTAREGIVVQSLGVEQKAGGVWRAYYDASQDGLEGRVRVWQESGPAARDECAEYANRTTVGRVTIVGDPADARRVCLTEGDAEITLWQDGGEGTWQGVQLVDFARDLQRTDTEWLASHLRAA